MQAWINADFKGKSPTVVIRAYGVLAGILDVAVREKLVNANLARGVIVPRKVKGMHDYLTTDQLKALVDECGSRGDFVLFLARPASGGVKQSASSGSTSTDAGNG